MQKTNFIEALLLLNSKFFSGLKEQPILITNLMQGHQFSLLETIFDQEVSHYNTDWQFFAAENELVILNQAFLYDRNISDEDDDTDSFMSMLNRRNIHFFNKLLHAQLCSAKDQAKVPILALLLNINFYFRAQLKSNFLADYMPYIDLSLLPEIICSELENIHEKIILDFFNSYQGKAIDYTFCLCLSAFMNNMAGMNFLKTHWSQIEKNIAQIEETSSVKKLILWLNAKLTQFWYEIKKYNLIAGDIVEKFNTFNIQQLMDEELINLSQNPTTLFAPPKLPQSINEKFDLLIDYLADKKQLSLDLIKDCIGSIAIEKATSLEKSIYFYVCLLILIHLEKTEIDELSLNGLLALAKGVNKDDFNLSKIEKEKLILFQLVKKCIMQKAIIVLGQNTETIAHSILLVKKIINALDGMGTKNQELFFSLKEDYLYALVRESAYQQNLLAFNSNK